MTLTYAKVRILTRRLKVGKISKRLDIDENRLTKIITGKYPAKDEERRALALELELPEHLVLEDVAPMFESNLPVAIPYVGDVNVGEKARKRKKSRK